MSEEYTTAAMQRYLDAQAGDEPAEPIVRAYLESVGRQKRPAQQTTCEDLCLLTNGGHPVKGG